MNEHAPRSGAEVLDRIQPRRRIAKTAIVVRPDLLEQWEDANEELRASRERDAAGPGRLTDKGSEETLALARRVQELEQEIEDTQLHVTMQALSKDEWQALTERHPPRKGNRVDEIVGWNKDAVRDEAVRLCCIDPVFDEESWKRLTSVLNPSEWEELRVTADRANEGVVELPKSALARLVLTNHAPDSEPPSSGT